VIATVETSNYEVILPLNRQPVGNSKPRKNVKKKSTESFRSRGGNGRSLHQGLRVIVGEKLEDATYIVFDLETTGGNPEKNGITEIAALKVKNGQIVDRFHSMVNPLVPIPPIVRKMTGITRDMVKDAPIIDEVFPSFYDFIGDHILVSHNTTGDLIFLRHFCQETLRHDLPNFFLCTHLLVEKLMPEAPDKSLKGLSAYLRFSGAEFHRAEADAIQTNLLFQHLLTKLHERGAVRIEHAIRIQGDLDSGMRLGWSVPEQLIQSLPNQPGVFFLFDHERKMLFASGALNIHREVSKLQQFSLIPRPVLRACLKAYDIKFERSSCFFSALNAECEILETYKLQPEPALFHQRQVQAIGLYQDERSKGLRLSVGPLETPFLKCYGPVKDRRLALELISELASTLGEKETQSGMLVSDRNRDLVVSMFDNDLEGYERSLESRIFKLRLFFWKRTALQEEQSKLEMTRRTLLIKGLMTLPWGDLTKSEGVVFSPSDDPSQCTVHLVTQGIFRSKQTLKVSLGHSSIDRSSLEEKLVQGGYAKRLVTKIRKENKSLGKVGMIQRGDLNRLNSFHWWLHFGSAKDLAVFYSLDKLEAMSRTKRV
jgi:DNA polymerase-3 subunit epsilon